jgi:hypothetical protein
MWFSKLFDFLSETAGPLVKRALAALGIGTATFTGLNATMDEARSFLVGNFSGLTADVSQLMGMFKFDVAINIVLSAVVTRLALSAAKGFNDKFTTFKFMGD